MPSRPTVARDREGIVSQRAFQKLWSFQSAL